MNAMTACAEACSNSTVSVLEVFADAQMRIVCVSASGRCLSPPIRVWPVTCGAGGVTATVAGVSASVLCAPLCALCSPRS